MSSNGPRLEGGCLCRRVRYAIEGAPRVVSHCHCGLCRKSTGAAFATWLTVRQTAVQLQGELRWYQSSEHGRRGFCAVCGSPLLSMSDHYAKYYEITAGSLDDCAAIEPTRHVFAAYRVPWLDQAPELPAHSDDSRSPLVAPAAPPAKNPT